jgi:hypothetical protein
VLTTLAIETSLLSRKLSTRRHVAVLDTKPLFSGDIYDGKFPTVKSMTKKLSNCLGDILSLDKLGRITKLLPITRIALISLCACAYLPRDWLGTPNGENWGKVGVDFYSRG